MLNYRELSQAGYDALVRQFVRLTESLHSAVQDVGDGKVAIDYGYTFNKSDSVSIWQASGIQLGFCTKSAAAGIAACKPA